MGKYTDLVESALTEGKKINGDSVLPKLQKALIKYKDKDGDKFKVTTKGKDVIAKQPHATVIISPTSKGDAIDVDVQIGIGAQLFHFYFDEHKNEKELINAIIAEIKLQTEDSEENDG